MGIVEKGKQGCAADLEAYCSSVTPGEGRLAFCLTAHADKRSASCERALAVARSEAETLINELDQSIQACAPDIASMCSGTQPGEGRIAQCLLEQREKLGSSCGQVVDKLSRIIFAPKDEPQSSGEAPAATPAGSTDKAEAQALEPGRIAAFLGSLDSKVADVIENGKKGCALDLEKYCASVKPGEGRLALCLTAHADKRSASCETALAVARTEAESLINEANASIEACAPDIAALCPGTKPGEGRIAQCLAEQRDKLSQACGQILDRLGRVIFAPKNQPAVVEGASSAVGSITTSTLPSEKSDKQFCRSLEVSVTDWGHDATKQDARKLLRQKVKSFAASRDIDSRANHSESVACSANLDILVTAYYTCRAKTQVCWTPAKQ